jgi:hypothetical protein
MPSGRECRLFGDLCEALANGPSRAFAILNSQREVDIESMAWSVVPGNIQLQALDDAGWKGFDTETQTYPPKAIGKWTAWRRPIRFVSDNPMTWWVVWIKSDDLDDMKKIGSEETRVEFPRLENGKFV